MKYKIIDVPRNIKSGGQGAFGTYYKVTPKVGVKTVYDKDFSSLKEAKESWEIRSAEKELDRLKEVYKNTKMTPKGYYVAILRIKTTVKNKYTYKVGYAMQHLNGQVVEYSKVKNSHEMWEKAKVRFESKGYKQIDGHSCNAIVVKTRGKRAKVVFIDAGGIVPVSYNGCRCSWE